MRTPYQTRLASTLADWKPKGGIADKPGVTTMELKDLPMNVVRDLQRVDNPKYLNGFNIPILGPAMRIAHNAWKEVVTVVNPAFQTRNLGSNQVLSALDVGKEMMNAKLYVDVAGVMAGRQGKMVNRLGQEYTYDEIRQLLRETGTHKAGWGRQERELVTGLASKVSHVNPLKIMRKVGNVIENEGRTTNFIAHLYKGDSALEAAKGASKALFDYADITDMDRAIKWVIPFWTFSKKHAELLAKTLITHPGRITAEMRLGKNIGEAILGGKEVQKEDLRGLPEFYKEGLKIARVGENNAIEILSGLGLPIEDLENYPVFSGPERFFSKAVAGRASPVIKLPAELFHNKDYFFGAPLEPSGMITNSDGTVATAYNKSYPVMEKMPQALKTFLEFEKIPTKDGAFRYTINSYKLKQLELFALGIASVLPAFGTPLIFSRYYRDIGKLTDESKPKMSRALDALTGVRIYDLPGTTDLKTRAAARQTNQINNLLAPALSKQKKKAGM